MEGRRFFFGRDLKGFLTGDKPLADGGGGDFEEFVMLNLRLSKGLNINDCKERFENGEYLFNQVAKMASKLPESLININESNISLSPEGFLVSNAVILKIIG